MDLLLLGWAEIYGNTYSIEKMKLFVNCKSLDLGF
jgi:hypothetical protein